MSLKGIGRELNCSHVAVLKRIRRLELSRLPKSLESLSEKEKQFCLSVVGGKSRINAVMQTYDVTSRESAKALQRTLMKNPEIRIAIDDLMEQKGIGRELRIEKLGEHMKSHDPVVTLKALDMGFKLADDAGERKGNDQEKLTFTKFDLTFLRSPADFKKLEGRCAICKTESVENFCVHCHEKYPQLIEKTIRYWNGDECATCRDDRRCFDFCKDCKEGKQNV